jgi:hypothetical protein
MPFSKETQAQRRNPRQNLVKSAQSLVKNAARLSVRGVSFVTCCIEFLEQRPELLPRLL